MRKGAGRPIWCIVLVCQRPSGTLSCEARPEGSGELHVAGGCQLVILPNKTSFEINLDIQRITEPPSGLKAKKNRMVKENKGKRWSMTSSVSTTVDFSPIHQ